jgi:hypothetical protein
MSGKILCMTMEHLKFIDRIWFLPFPLRKLSGAFGLTASKSWYPHYFNSMEYLDYVGQIPDLSYYGVIEMNVGERTKFLDWYEDQNPRSLITGEYWNLIAKTMLRS